MSKKQRISLAEASRCSGKMLNRGRSDEIDEEASPTLDDLAESIYFSPGDGRIWLNDQRMLLFHSDSLARLRREFVDVMGIERARAAFTRVGYEQGARDAQLIRSRWPDESVAYAFAAGPRIHTLEGFVRASTVEFEFDMDRGNYYGEFLWHESSEADEYVSTYGLSHSPVCWMQTGYATGYTSWLVGKLILFREVECRAQGHPHCRPIAKPLADWGKLADDFDFKTFEAEPKRRRSRKTKSHSIKTPVGYSKTVVGMSSSFTAARHMLERVATTNATTLLVGESGVGKELFARTLHDLSQRREQNFIAINCAAIPETLIESELFGVDKGAYTGATASRPGRFERASGGTLFLDEIGSLSMVAQGKLLRALQEQEIERVGGNRVIKVDVRVVAATNIDLREQVTAGHFRQDLFYRLNVFPIELPPLRERRDDIPLLMEHFLHSYSEKHGRNPKGFTHKATDAMLHYDYPGNLREMQNLIERGVVYADDESMIDVVHMFRGGENIRGHAFAVGKTGPLVKEARTPTVSVQTGEFKYSSVKSQPTLEEFERQLMLDTLQQTSGNVSAAARTLGISRAKLDYRLRKLGLLPEWGSK